MHADADRTPTARQRALTTTWVHPVLLNVGIAIAYFGAAKLGFLLASSTRQVTAVWPPTGIALVALVLFRWRAAPGVFASGFTVSLTNDEALYAAAGIAAGNTLGPWIGAVALRRVAHIDVTLARVRDVISLVTLGAFASMALTATNGVAWLAISGIIDWAQYFSVWWIWWVGDTMGVLIIAPLRHQMRAAEGRVHGGR